MKLFQIAFRISRLDEKMMKNMKYLKENKDNSKSAEFQDKLNETSEIACELEFYKNQFEEIERYFDVKFY